MSKMADESEGNSRQALKKFCSRSTKNGKKFFAEKNVRKMLLAGKGGT